MRNYGASPELLSKILKAPLQNVKAILPSLHKSMELWGLTSRHSAIAIYATISTETSRWELIREQGSKEYFKKTYGKYYNELGPEDESGLPKYRGASILQLTWPENFLAYSKAAKIAEGKKAYNNPNILLKPDVAADSLCHFFVINNVYKAAADKDWEKVRRIINGGTNGLDVFIKHVKALDKALVI